MTVPELQEALSNVQQWSTLSALVLIGVGFVLALLPVGVCDKCQHCRAERLQSTLCSQHHLPKTECRDQHRP